jgi:hypothetical protein
MVSGGEPQQSFEALLAPPVAPAVEIIDFGRRGDPDQLVCGDALAPLTRLADHRLDAIYIDPPFGTGAVRARSIVRQRAIRQ